MNTVSSSTPNEVLIERSVTFRRSTFDALKEYMRRHKERTGIALTNAAAIDRLLRAQLAEDIARSNFPTVMVTAKDYAAALEAAAADVRRAKQVLA